MTEKESGWVIVNETCYSQGNRLTPLLLPTTGDGVSV